MGRWLVLGGTGWLGREIARVAVGRGHRVTCLARGESGSVPPGVRWVRADRDREDAFAQLSGGWDVVVDVGWQPGHVRRALDALARRTHLWAFISTANVYADLSGPVTEESALRGGVDASVVGLELYGEAKVACESAVMGHPNALILRAGLMAGPGDPSDRFGYWPARCAAAGAGDVVVPDVPGARVQVVDVRDVATYVVDAADREVVGVFNVAGRSRPLIETLRRVAQVSGFEGRFVPVAPQILDAAKVNRWAGPRSLPLWLPPQMGGLMRMDCSRAETAGLRRRSLETMVADVLADEVARGVGRARIAGLDRREELDLLATV